MNVKFRRKSSALLVAFSLLFSIIVPLFSSPVYAVTMPEIGVSKDDHLDSVVPGQTVTYKIDVSSGDADAADVVVTETLPDYTTFNSWYLNNAIANGGFELGGFTGWVETDPGDGLTVGGVAHSGDYGLVVYGDGSGSEDGYIEQELCPQVPVDDVAEFSIWGMTNYNRVGIEITVTYEGATPSPADDLTTIIDYAKFTDGWPTFPWSKKDLSTHLLSGEMIKKIKLRGSQQMNPWDNWKGFFDDLVLKVNLDGPPFVYERCLLEEGDLLSFTFIVDVDDPVPSGVGAIVNEVEVSAAGVSPVIAVDEDLLDAAPDIVVVKEDDSPASVVPGQTVTYDITVANVGNQDATGVEVEETVPKFTTFNAAGSTPGWSCSDGDPAGTTCLYTLGALGVGDSDPLEFAVDVGDSPVPAGIESIENTVVAADDESNGADLVPENNLYLDSDSLDAAPDLQIVKSDGGLAEVLAGGTVVYTLSYVNAGSQGATGVMLEEAVPAYTSFNAAGSFPGWSCADGAPAGTICRYNVGSLAVGEGGSVSLAVTVVATLPSGVDRITNRAFIYDDGGSGTDLSLGDNEDSDETPANPGEIMADSTVAGEAVVGTAEEGVVGEEELEEGEVKGAEEAPFEEVEPEEEPEEAAGGEACRDPLWWILVLLVQGILSFIVIRRSEDWEDSALIVQVIISLVAMIILWRFFCTWWLPLVAIILGISSFYLTSRELKSP